jgi:hypothetical protein
MPPRRRGYGTPNACNLTWFAKYDVFGINETTERAKSSARWRLRAAAKAAGNHECPA